MRTSLQKLVWLIGIVAALGAPTAAMAHPPIDIAVANWKFTPNKITVTVNEPVTLHFTSTSGVHGVESKDLGIKQTAITPGKPVDVTFTPAKAGTYVIHCSIVCGAGHADMALTIVVTP
jgi:cytochrome c oxidase subunit 2